MTTSNLSRPKHLGSKIRVMQMMQSLVQKLRERRLRKGSIRARSRYERHWTKRRALRALRAELACTARFEKEIRRARREAHMKDTVIQ